MLRTLRAAAVVSAGLVAVLAAGPAHAQDVTVQSTSQLKLGGAMGSMMRMMGGSKENVETSSISGHKMRMDQGKTATIIDVDAGTITTLNNDKKTYSTMTFEQLAQAMAAAQAQMKESYEQSKKESQAKGEDAPRMDFKYDVKVDRTGEKQKIAGYDAERAFLTLQVETRAAEDQKSEMQEAGTMVVLEDIWLSSSAPGAATKKEFEAAYAKRAKTDLGNQFKALAMVFGQNPEAKEALSAASKEMQKLDGMPLRTTVYLALVPPGMKFDRDLALGGGSDDAKKGDEASGKKKGGLGGFMGKLAAKAAAAQAGSDDSDQKAAPKQGTLFTMITEVKDIKVGAVPASAFSVPAGYREIKPDMDTEH